MTTTLIHEHTNTDQQADITADIPAPWALKGRGLVIVLKGGSESQRNDPAIPAQLRSSLKQPVRLLMLVDYAQSNAGPYKELLFVPGSVLFGQDRRYTISNIFVSSMTSVVNGRANWGIPKNLCDFDWVDDADGTSRVTASLNGQSIATIAYRGKGPHIPINTAWVPSFAKTLEQVWQGQRFRYSPQAKGKARLAHVSAFSCESSAFPIISQKEILAAFAISSFDMIFPVAQVL